METEHKGHFKFENGVSLDIDPGLLISSSVVKEAASNASSSFEVPVTNEIDQNELELMNEFTALLREKFAEDFKSKAASKDFWFEFIPRNLHELKPLANKIEKDVLIGSANAADILDVPSFLSFCTYFLVERSANMNLEDLRDFLNEENDFTEEQRQIIAECPELANL